MILETNINLNNKTKGELIMFIEEAQHIIQKQQNELEKKDKVIDAMAVELYNYANLGMLNICPAEQENGNYNLELCKMSLAERNCCLCIEEYFYKKVEG